MKWGYILSIILISSTASAAISDKDRVSFGVHGGVTFGGAAVRNAEATDDITRRDLGFAVGFAMETPPLVGSLYLQPELNYSRSASSQPSLAGAKFDYIELPLLMRAKLFRVFSVALGPSPAYLVAASSENGVLSRSQFRSFDLRGIVDVSLEFPVSENSLIRVGARYVRGMLDIDPNAAERRNENFYTYLGVLF